MREEDHPLCLQGDLGGPLGSTVTQQNCDTTYTSASQLWQPVSVSGDIYKFENIGTGRCLEARNGAVNGGAVDLWDCTSGESNERWYWPPSTTAGRSPFPGPNPVGPLLLRLQHQPGVHTSTERPHVAAAAPVTVTVLRKRRSP